MELMRRRQPDTIAIYNFDKSLVIQNKPDVNKLIAAFLADEEVEANSIQTYKRNLKQFFLWIETTPYQLSELARRHILEYKNYLSEVSKKELLTIDSYITVVRKFYTWADANDYYTNIAKGIKVKKGGKKKFRKKSLSLIQTLDFLNYAESQSPRDKAILNLMVRTGLRTIEVSRLKIGSIDYKGGKRVLHVHGKGRFEADEFVLLSDDTYQPIVNYLATRDNYNDSSPLFTSTSNNSKGGDLSTRTISKIGKEALKGIGLDSKFYTAHSLRHTAAVNLKRAGATTEDVREVLRHEDVRTTEIYTGILKEEERLEKNTEGILDNLYKIN